MSPVEFWAKTRFTSWHRVTWEELSLEKRDKTKHVVLVENQLEEDFVFSLQMILGIELNIRQYDGNGLENYSSMFQVVYTTWDPSDRNRI